MSAVNLLASSAKADTGVGAALDVSAGSTLRLDATLKANMGKTPVLTLAIETAPNASGPWVQIYSRRFETSGASSVPWPTNGIQRIAGLSGLDSFARVRWSGQAGNVSNNAPTDSTAEFDLGVAGTLT